MSETYVVTVIKYDHAKQDEDGNGKTAWSADFVVDDWTTDPIGRTWAECAAASFFYYMAETLIDLYASHAYDVMLPLIELIPENVIQNMPEHYWGDWLIEDHQGNCAYQVIIFRHYHAEHRVHDAPKE